MDYKLKSSSNSEYFIHLIKKGEKILVDLSLLKKSLDKSQASQLPQHEELDQLLFKVRNKNWKTNHSYPEWFGFFLPFAKRVQKDFIIEDSSFWKTTKAINHTFSSETILEKSNKLFSKIEDGFSLDFISLDVESTGLSITNDSIIQFSAVKYSNGKLVEKFDRFVKPSNGKKISLFTTDLTGIQNSDVESSKSFEEVWDEFINNFYSGEQLIGQNLKFDLSIINSELEKVEKTIPYFSYADTMTMVKKMFPDLGRGQYKLEKLKSRFLSDEISNLSSHNSLNDCIIAAELYKFLLSKLDKNGR